MEEKNYIINQIDDSLAYITAFWNIYKDIMPEQMQEDFNQFSFRIQLIKDLDGRYIINQKQL